MLVVSLPSGLIFVCITKLVAAFCLKKIPCHWVLILATLPSASFETSQPADLA